MGIYADDKYPKQKSRNWHINLEEIIMLKMNNTIHENIQEIKCAGKLDFESCDIFDNYFTTNHNTACDVIINLEDLSYISSIGLRSLIKAAKAISTAQKQIYLKAKDGPVKQIIQLSGFVKIMPFIG